MANATTARLISACVIGTVLEWYDFAIYGYFAAEIGRAFFPAGDKVAQILSAFAVFAVGFVVRPVGGVIVGHIGDWFGRRTALILSVTAMAVPTFLVGALPGFDIIGLWAPVLLVLFRLIQGLSAGGEYTTSVVFMVEHAPPERRGLVGAATISGSVAGILLGSAVGAVLGASMPADSLADWGWRIPFLAGLIVGFIGLFLRNHMPDAPVERDSELYPLIRAVRHHKPVLAWHAALTMFNAGGFYVMFVYVVSWLQFADGMAPGQALEINTISMLVLVGVSIVAGWLSDIIGRKPVMLAGTLLGLVGAYPLLRMMYHTDPTTIQLAQLGFAVSIGLFFGPQPAAQVEATPREVRCTAFSLGYNLCLGVVGGLTPLTAAWLVSRTGDEMTPAFLTMFGAAISTVAILRFRETRDL